MYAIDIKSFDGIIACLSGFGCMNSYFSNGKIMVCMGDIACGYLTITNIDTVIAMGAGALHGSKLIGVQRVLSLSTKAIYNTSIDISNTDKDNFEIYCQNDFTICEKFKKENDGIYCYNTTDVYLSLDIDINTTLNLSATNLSNLVYCSLQSHAPTNHPTSPPTESQFSRDMTIILIWLQKYTVIIALVMVVLSIILVLLSIYCRRRRHEDTLSRYKSKILQWGLINGDDSDHYNDSSNHNDSIRAIYGDKINDPIKNKNNSTVASYVRGFAKNASHLVILHIIFEMYDVFTDVSYLIELYHDQLYKYFYIFLTSMIMTIVINAGLLILFVKNSFKNYKFEKWFWTNSGIIIFLMCFCY